MFGIRLIKPLARKSSLGLRLPMMRFKPVNYHNNPINVRSYATVKTDNIDWNPMLSSKQLSKEGNQAGGKSRKVVFVILCLTPVVTFMLGMWQLRRLKWKNKLVAECEDRLTYKSSPLPSTFDPKDLPDFEYRKVSVTGHFDYSREIFVGPRLHDDKKGYLLICPFVQSNGAGDILVERGWIADENIDPEVRNLQHLSCPKGEITLTCLLRAPAKRGTFQMEHQKGSRLFHYVDLNAMSEETHTRPIYAIVIEDYHEHPDWMKNELLFRNGLMTLEGKVLAEDKIKQLKSSLSWFGGNGEKKKEIKKIESLLEEINKECSQIEPEYEYDVNQLINAGVPLGKFPKIDYKNNHMQYLVTWFGLSFASAILLAIVIRKGKIISPKAEKLSHAKKFLG
ncbi:hypothetical protein BVG19_g50 [[Candida] boidinii]|nr:hypothetical protein BVG19_g50 [[Candida] boidinii]OWB53402.1 hypothetical protein B5S27_g4998 [[Candida] boidinii]OWB85735.1 hypothetical protein B5S33_g4406 [[Candida] boidinii]